MTAPARLRKNRYVSHLKKSPEDGREFVDLFAVVSKKLALSSRDKPYLRLTLGDRTGSIDAFVWDNAPEYAAQLEEGDVVEVRGRPQVHKDTPQLRVDHLRKVEDLGAVDPSEFRPGLDAMVRQKIWEDTVRLLAQVGNPFVAALLRTYTDDLALREAYLEAPAAKSFHHAYVGGLAEHTLAVMRLAWAVAELYPGRLQRDLLVAGAFLHDVAKVEEMCPRTGAYTDAGRLLGHIALGARRLRERAAGVPDFPEPLLLHLEHLILSHHERIDWGSPVEPQTLEAMALNFIDNLDAKLAGAWAWLEGEEVPAGGWSSYWKGLGRQLHRAPGCDLPGTGNQPAAGFADIEAEFLRREASESREEAGPAAPARRKPKPTPPAQGDLGF